MKKEESFFVNGGIDIRKKSDYLAKIEASVLKRMVYAFGLDRHIPDYPMKKDYVNILSKNKKVTVAMIDDFLKRN